MSTATLSAPAPTVRPGNAAVRAAARRLADAVAEFDAALDEGRPMFTLVRLDQEVVAATRGHHEAVTRLAVDA